MQQVYDFLCNKLRFTREDMRLWKVSSKDEVSIQDIFLCPRDDSQGALRFAPVCPSVCPSVHPFVTLYGIEFV